MKMFLLILGALVASEVILFGAEAGMPQLDPKYWYSQAFWLILVFTLLYLTISKFFVPKIKNGLDDRDNKIKDDLDEAKSLKDLADKKLLEYEDIIKNGKKEVQKIMLENKNKLNNEIKNKKEIIEKEIEKEIENAQKEILSLKKSSINDISKISGEIASKIIEEISGDKLNQSSIEAAIKEYSKKNINNLL